MSGFTAFQLSLIIGMLTSGTLNTVVKSAQNNCRCDSLTDGDFIFVFLRRLLFSPWVLISIAYSLDNLVSIRSTRATTSRTHQRSTAMQTRRRARQQASVGRMIAHLQHHGRRLCSCFSVCAMMRRLVEEEKQ